MGRDFLIKTKHWGLDGARIIERKKKDFGGVQAMKPSKETLTRKRARGEKRTIRNGEEKGDAPIKILRGRCG